MPFEFPSVANLEEKEDKDEGRKIGKPVSDEVIISDSDLLSDGENDETSKLNEEQGREVEIPSKVYNRLIAKIFKLIARESSVQDPVGILKGIGLRGEEAYFEKAEQEAQFLMKTGEKLNRENNRIIEEERKKVEENRRNSIYARNAIENEEDWKSWEIRKNIEDSVWMGEVKDFLKRNRGNAAIIDSFWKEFDQIVRKKEKKKDARIIYSSPEMIKNGILGELSAERLFAGLEDYLSSKKDEPGFDADSIGNFFIEQSTPQEDVMQQIDMFINFTYKGEALRLPVQVKSPYVREYDAQGRIFYEENVCSFYHPAKIEQGNDLDEKRRKFYKYNKFGIFVMLPHGYGTMEITNDGTPSRSLEHLFYEKFAKELPAFLIKIDNKKEYGEKWKSAGYKL